MPDAKFMPKLGQMLTFERKKTNAIKYLTPTEAKKISGKNINCNKN